MNTIKELILAEMKRDSSAGVDSGVLKTALRSADLQTSQTEIENCIREIQRERAEQERQKRLTEFLAQYEPSLRKDYPDLEAEFGLDGESGRPRIVLWLEGKPSERSGIVEHLMPEGKAAGV